MILAIAGKLPWHTARASGLVAWTLSTASIVLGLSTAARLVRQRGVPAWMMEMHKFLGVLTLVFTGIHVGGLALDDFVQFRFVDFVVPMASDWRPGAVATGIVATYLLLAVQLSSWLIRHVRRRLWHTIHMSSLVMFVLATVHGLWAGHDRNNRLVQWLLLTGVVLTVFAACFRGLTRRPKRRQPAIVPDP